MLPTRKPRYLLLACLVATAVIAHLPQAATAITLVENNTKIKLAAVGDSLTEGFCTSNEETMPYPTKLQKMLTVQRTPPICGAGNNNNIYNNVKVRNFGVSGRTMMRSGDLPYWDTKAFQESLDFNPDIVTLMLGTNDSKMYQWNEEDFINSYLDMLDVYKSLPSKPKIYMMMPPPLYEDNIFTFNAKVINKEFPERIFPLIANRTNSNDDSGSNNTVILTDDIFYGMGGPELSRWQLFCDDQSCDSIHPNDAGYDFMASLVYGKIFLKPLPSIDYSLYEDNKTATVA